MKSRKWVLSNPQLDALLSMAYVLYGYTDRTNAPSPWIRIDIKFYSAHSEHEYEIWVSISQ